MVLGLNLQIFTLKSTFPLALRHESLYAPVEVHWERN